MRYYKNYMIITKRVSYIRRVISFLYSSNENLIFKFIKYLTPYSTSIKGTGGNRLSIHVHPLEVLGLNREWDYVTALVVTGTVTQALTIASASFDVIKRILSSGKGTKEKC